ncbi:putative serine/threonine-protein kinase iks1 [Coelomomyces lativittatus]|nr:putative serine/threonine-protein kinase iks1 [Coelomomyces lativittatus]
MSCFFSLVLTKLIKKKEKSTHPKTLLKYKKQALPNDEDTNVDTYIPQFFSSLIFLFNLVFFHFIRPTVMISDFGECEKLSNDTLDSRTGATGTLDFTAPELLENKEGIYIHRYSVKADIWSFGLLAYFVCFGSLPFTQIDDVDLLKTEISTFSIHQWQYPYRPQVPERLIKLIQACLSRIPSERPSSKTVVNWIMDIQTEVAGETMNSFTSTTSIPRSTNDAKSPPSATIPSTATTTTNAHNTTTRSTVVSAPQFLQLPPPTPLTSSFKDLIQTDSWLLGLTISIKLACMFQASFIVFLFCFLSVLGDIIFKWHRLGYWNPLLHLLLVSLIYILETQGTRP